MRVLIIGAGVSGLTTAYKLIKQNVKVTVMAKDYPPNTTSNIAGALWEWPPAVCGYVQTAGTIAREQEWAIESYKKFIELQSIPDTGVCIRTVNFYFTELVQSNSYEFNKMTELKKNVFEFQHSSLIIEKNQINQTIGIRDAYSYLAPVVDTDKYMYWLHNELTTLGCSFYNRPLTYNLQESVHTLLREFDADYVVNCTGLGSLELVDDTMFPVRGGLIRIHNNGKYFPKINEAHCTSITDTLQKEFIFILPRNEDYLVLGGFAEPNEQDLGITPSNNEIFSRIFERCVEFLPQLKNAEIDSDTPYRVGLRPYRKSGVRVEKDSRNPKIIHNYGHGGSGVLLSWGCANDVYCYLK